MCPLALTAAGGLLVAIVGFVLYGLAGGVEAGYLGNERLGNAGGTLLIVGILLFVGGLICLVVAAVVGAVTDRGKRTRDRDR